MAQNRNIACFLEYEDVKLKILFISRRSSQSPKGPILFSATRANNLANQF